MFTPEEIEIAKRAKELGKTREEALAGIAKYRASQSKPVTPEPTQEKPGILQQAKDVGIGFAKGVGSTIKGIADFGRPIQAAIDPTRTLADLKANAEQQPYLNDEALKATNKAQMVGKGIEFAGELLSPIGATNAGKKAIGAVINTVGKKAGATTNLIKNASSVVKEKSSSVLKTPEKTVAGAVGEVIQGKPTDIAQGVKAFKEIDTTGVKTYADLGNRIDDSIKRLSQTVDTELGKDSAKTLLGELDTTLKTKSGIPVRTNYVDTALKQMKELYEKTGDIKAAADIDELIATATKEGLSKQDINNIARVYNAEFGSKAFSKVGDPLTSVNAQLYETVRKGLKGKAREGIGGEEARAADEAISSLYNTKTLVTKNIEAVNKLQQRIAERGLAEKAGYYLTKYADILSGGTIRGMVGGLLPRGAGYKTLNALDLEERLQANLDIIKRASEATDEAAINKILSELEG